jgi:putative hemolysin/Tol biopolymer transport system component
MFRKALIPVLMLMGMALLAACSPKPASPTAKAGMANPASVYCEQKGGKLELRQDASGGVAGICIFPDGSECDEWAYFRGECQPGGSPVTAEPVSTLAAGLRIVYFNGGHVLYWMADSRAHELAQGNAESLRISEDGQAVAYLGSDSAGIFGLHGVNADGTNPRLLVQNTQPPGQIVSFDFAPASHTVYFVTDQYDLQRMDAESVSPVPIFGAGKGGFFSFSPDGQWMAVYHPNELVLAHPDGSAARLAFQYPDDFRYTMLGPEIVWKDDSSGFSMVSASGPQGDADSMTVWFVPVAGEAVKQMSYAGPYGANLSPDGKSVVYLNFQHDPADVHMVTADGKDTICGSYASNEYPGINFMGWTPDSKSFLLNLSSDARLMDPYLCAAGKNPVKLTDTQHAYPVVWVDAERFLFISDGSLRLQRRAGASISLDSVSSSNFDFTVLKP